MKRTYDTNDTNQPLTLLALCQALTDQHLPAKVEDGYYVVRHGDLKRFVQADSAGSIPTMLALFASAPVQVAS